MRCNPFIPAAPVGQKALLLLTTETASTPLDDERAP
jgi:hypothetical protein